jgi:hypothetical protein
VRKTVLLDFDGVMHSYVSGWTGPVPTDPPTPGALEFVQALQASGCEVIVFTTRAMSPEGIEGTMEWLVQHGFPSVMVTCEKVPAMCLVDDRAIRYERGKGFDAVLEEVQAFIERRLP